MLEGSESPKSPHKLVLPENVSISAFYTINIGEMDPKEAKLVNLAKKQVCKSISAEVRDPKNGCGHISKINNSTINHKCKLNHKLTIISLFRVYFNKKLNGKLLILS